MDVGLLIKEEDIKSAINAKGEESCFLFNGYYFDNSEQLLKHLEAYKLDCILFELDCSDQDEIDKFETLKKEIPLIPIVLLSNVQDEVLTKMLRRIGAHGVWPLSDIFNMDVIARMNFIAHRNVFGRLLTELDMSEPNVEKCSVNLEERDNEILKHIEQLHARMISNTMSDNLTGLANRPSFEENFHMEVSRARRYNNTLALLCIDLDNFKSVNESLGYQYGDALLKEIATRISSSVRDSDFVARIAGDEFAIILNNIESAHGAGIVAHKVVEALWVPYSIEGKIIHSGCSIGIACYPNAGETAQQLSQSADMALYLAKNTGKNAYQYYSKELNAEHRRRLNVEQALRMAIENDEFHLVFQAQYECEKENLYGFESLIRWENELLGSVGPAEFIPIAEKCGMIESIGHWVVENSVKQLATWQKEHKKKFKLSINISIHQLREPLVALLQKLKEENEKEVIDCIELELTETAVMHDDQLVMKFLNQLSEMGFHFAVDDFGTGYSSLSRLQTMPIDILKIDRSFVTDLNSDGNNQVLVKSIIDMARNLDLKIIAEGVETEYQLAYLKDNGCDIGQGYYFAKPQPANEVEEILKQAN